MTAPVQPRVLRALVISLCCLGAAPLASPLAAAAAAGASTTAPAAVSRAARRLKPCQLPGVEGGALCGTLSVWEDRTAQRRRRIDLNVVVLEALGPAAEGAADAVTVLGGGPGEAATDDAGFLSLNAAMRRRRDILLVDQRGTGKSNPLNCDFYGPGSHDHGADPKLLAGDLFPADKVRECRDLLSRRADLKLYTTALGMDDLDEVRAWLGYPQLDVIGGSYGTRAAQVYLRRHPAAVRAVVLDGVLPVDEPIPLHHAYAGKRAIDLLLAECARDAACHAAFPNLAGELAEVMQRIDRGVSVQVPDSKTGGTFEVTPSRGLISEGFRFMMYGSNARRLPLAIHTAYQGDLAQLVQIASERRAELDHILAMGMNFSVTCAEDLPYIDDATAARLTAGTLLGDYRIAEQKRVCSDWPRGAIPADAHTPVRSPAPVLLISGERDPVTPPEFGEHVAAGLPNGLLVIVPHGSHGVQGECADGVVDRFLDAASVRGLDVACLKSPPPTAFVTKLPAEVQVPAAVLDGYAGTYDLQGTRVTVARSGGHLIVAPEGGDATVLYAGAQDHFFAKFDDFDVTFVAGQGGAPAEMIANAGGTRMRGKRVAPH